VGRWVDGWVGGERVSATPHLQLYNGLLALTVALRQLDVALLQQL
jgi:hypothetical protein